MKTQTKPYFFLIAFTIVLAGCASGPSDTEDWSEYLGGKDRNHYSTLDQITPENVNSLQIAWSYDAPDSGQMQMSPVIYDGILYGVTAHLRVVALDAATGKELWAFGEPLREWYAISRGVSIWKGKNEARVFFSSGPNLWALDARTGKPVPGFGDGGKVDLHTGLPEVAKNKFILSATPGTIFEDLIIMPLRLSEDFDAAPGDVRAFNVHTGKLEWTFHTIPWPGEDGYETWENKDAWKNLETGAANNWSGMAVDPELGIVYVPTGSAGPDFYGGRRLGSNLYANCLLALNARTGKRIWHYQFVHHDIWDRDCPTPPNLITVTRNGKKIKAVAQLTKQAYVFVFDRQTGVPLFDIEEKPFPASVVPGEKAWPTQPIPVKPAQFSRRAEDLTENDISPYAPNRGELLEQFRAADRRFFAPPDTARRVLLLPGYDGGAEWGGTGADPEAGIIYVNANEMAWWLQLEPNSDDGASLGQQIYSARCVSCHQQDRKGIPASGYPSLIGLDKKYTEDQVRQIIRNGKGRMPGFPQLNKDELNAIVGFLNGNEKKEVTFYGGNPAYAPRYRHTGYDKFLDANGLPAISPPWGTLNAIDLNTGEYLWKIPYGETRSLRDQGHPQTGSESYGGPVVTANGLLFISGTKDRMIRAYDRHTGKKLWEADLPYAAFATPATYLADGRQFVAIACGGEKLGAAKGNKIVAFALPR